ncbi:hypothetical protein MRS76_09025 [Rhizobiaceae bacterium n13]|uniref:Uncharacterized protein n=1 Tax=Ferirhizobium litorale TaxID=2927786 RepID=A0AAE3QCJ5_9HYPH|nr:hypothetical protein [Fererhizobium litorale]MDI7862098.1 hypothetical protein [Fererhizobium litorale]MDI7922630.1 hypothetical protein [Fererhizobium litorale]
MIDESNNTPGEAKEGKIFTLRRLDRRITNIQSMQDPKEARRARNRLYRDLMRHIAEGTAKKPKLLAARLVENDRKSASMRSAAPVET